LNRDDGRVSRGDRLFKFRREGSGRHTARDVSTGLSRSPVVPGRAGIVTAAARNLRWLVAVVLLRLAGWMATLRDGRTTRRRHHCDRQGESREPLGQTCHDIPVHCSADARQKT